MTTVSESVFQPDTFQPETLFDLDSEHAVDALIRRAVELRASDLFFMTEERAVAIAVRRFGVVTPISRVSREQGRRLISHIKALAGMNIAEARRPLDGRWIWGAGEEQVELRVNCIATLFGSDLTMRLWSRETGLIPLDELGLAASDLRKVNSMLQRPSGLILVTGPTGAGKTTTLYACLETLRDGSRKINTLEDPVEFAIPGIRQSQVRADLGVDYPELLRNILRQAPDVIMIGEIRDSSTAATAVRAANSGHLVLSTLHAPRAAGALQSMFALNANPYFLSSCLLGVVAQRLVRTLCRACRRAYDVGHSDEIAETVALFETEAPSTVFAPGEGCVSCQGSGYSGRTGLFEVLGFNTELRRLTARMAVSREIHQAAVDNGMVDFRKSAMLKVSQGLTNIEDLLRDVPAECLGLED